MNIYDTIDWIEENHPGAIKFQVTESDLKSIVFYIHLNKQTGYHTMTLLYGILFSLALMDYFILNEQYESCHQIKLAIESINALCDANIPTDINNPESKRHLGMKPSEILNELITKMENKTK